MALLSLTGRAIGKCFRRAILAIAHSAPQPQRDLPPEYYRFPLF